MRPLDGNPNRTQRTGDIGAATRREQVCARIYAVRQPDEPIAVAAERAAAEAVREAREQGWPRTVRVTMFKLFADVAAEIIADSLLTSPEVGIAVHEPGTPERPR